MVTASLEPILAYFPRMQAPVPNLFSRPSGKTRRAGREKPRASLLSPLPLLPVESGPGFGGQAAFLFSPSLACEGEPAPDRDPGAGVGASLSA